MNVLDLGCGRGSGVYLLKKEYGPEAEVFGVDIDKRNIEIANKDFGEDCKFVFAKGEKLPFNKNFFDVVSSIEVLEHVQNLEETLGEIARVLKRGGVFIATFPNSKSERELLRFNKDYLKQIGHRRIINLDKFFKLTIGKFETKEVKIYDAIEHLYWRSLFRKGYKITSENGDLNKPAPRGITLIENILNPDKKLKSYKMAHKIIIFLNKIFSKLSPILDLFFIKKRVKVLLIKK